jgi:hypothetical protein
MPIRGERYTRLQRTHFCRSYGAPLELAPEGEWWERLQRRAAWRGGQDGHSDDKRRLDLSNHLVNENKCSGGHVAWAPRVSTSTEAR